jgi:hypothetical protein
MNILNINTDITPCLLNCSNNGECIYNQISNNFTCNCFENYTGSNCNIDKRPCNSAKLQCINNGICINNRTGPNKDDYTFACNCSYPFYGDRCQFKIKLCQNITCSKQGICLVVNDTQPVCKCFPNFSGNECEISGFKMKTIKAVGYISVGISIAFMAGFVGLIIYIDIVRFLRPDQDDEERMRKKEKKKKEKNKHELTQVQNQNQTIRLETITEENDIEGTRE